jgi:drug/metabolite transporter (DMT)-like permease
MAGEPGAIPRRGYLYVIIAAVLWAVSGTSGKFLFHHGITPQQLVQLRVTLSAVLLFFGLLATRPTLLRIAPGDIIYFAILGITGMSMVMFTYFYTISLINVAVAIVLEYVAPVFIAIYYAFIAPEKLSRTTLLAIGLSVIGCYLTVGAYNVDLLALNWKGILVGVCSGLAFAWYAVYGERGMRRYDPWTVVFYALLFATVFWNIAMPPFKSLRGSYSGVEWFWIVYIVVFGTAVPYGFYTTGISLIRSTRASVTATLEPITAALIAYVFLDEVLQPLQIFGGLLVIASVILLHARRECDETTSTIIRERRKEVPANPINPVW